MRVCGVDFVVCVHVSICMSMCMPMCSCQTIAWEVCTVVIIYPFSLFQCLFLLLFFSSSHDVLVCSDWMGGGS